MIPDHKQELDRVILASPHVIAQVTRNNTRPLNMLVGQVMKHNKYYDAKKITEDLYARLGLELPVKQVTEQVKGVGYTVGYETVGEIYRDEDGDLCRDPEVELYFKIKCRPFEPGLAESITKTGQEQLLKLLDIINRQIIEG